MTTRKYNRLPTRQTVHQHIGKAAKQQAEQTATYKGKSRNTHGNINGEIRSNAWL